MCYNKYMAKKKRVDVILPSSKPRTPNQKRPDETVRKSADNTNKVKIRINDLNDEEVTKVPEAKATAKVSDVKPTVKPVAKEPVVKAVAKTPEAKAPETKTQEAKVQEETKEDKVSEEMAKAKKSKKQKQSKPKNSLGFFARWRERRKAKKEAEARRKAEDLASLPKEPIKRFFARLHPKRVFRWWFSWRGQKAILKFIGTCFLLLVIFIAGLFLYYKKDLDEIRLDEMSISETVNTYLDRNGVLLWKDTGSENYRLVVASEEIPEIMKQATVAIEDKNFYNHIGVDLVGLTRAFFMTITGKQVQGGSTLTQQLIKQVYFADEAASSNRGGLSRKIKELILAIELERMYSKDEILTMYLNQSPYGGRRNGVESAARTYFGKSVKDLTLAECALLAAIPNNPAVFNPYNEYGHDQLIWRQQHTLDVMAELGYITSEEAEEAKAVDILATIKPESSQYADMKAPHFVLEVKKQLEEKYGISTMRAGGWTIITTLDWRLQDIAQDAVNIGMEKAAVTNRTNNMALVSIDVETSQVVAMVGSANFNNKAFGELNVTTDSLIEPGSSIKPILDYAPLFMQRDGINYGPGTILKDENIDKLYCNGAVRNCMTNATNTFYGNVSIRFSLGHSLNIAAVKALYINGIDNSLKVAHALGDEAYCKNRSGYGLSIAIGSGCGVHMVEHANAYASLARGGSYKPLSYVLEVKNSTGDTIEKWTDSPATRVVDEQVAYMVSSILNDRGARWANSTTGFLIPNVWTATKTGTTTTASSTTVKDSLIESYSPALSTFVWNGNADGSGFAVGSGDPVRFAVQRYMDRAHNEVYIPEGKYAANQAIAQPAGIKRLTVNGQNDIWPSWYDPSKNSGVTKETLVFNRYNYKLASSCTQEAFKIGIEVNKVMDPITKKESYNVPEPYNNEVSDTCDYTPPSVSLSTSGNQIIATIRRGSNAIVGYTLYVDGVENNAISVGSNGVINGYTLNGTEKSLKIMISDNVGYTAVATLQIDQSSGE